jgi:hypothetical protein
MTEFDKYAIKHMGIGSQTLHDYQNFQSAIPNLIGSVKPTIIVLLSES